MYNKFIFKIEIFISNYYYHKLSFFSNTNSSKHSYYNINFVIITFIYQNFKCIKIIHRDNP